MSLSQISRIKPISPSASFLCSLSRYALLLLLVSVVFHPQAVAQRWCCDGNDWLQWTKARRQSYVRGFIEGYYVGCAQACEKAANPSLAPQGSAPRRTQQVLDFGTGTEELADRVTEFYKRYPENRILTFEEVVIEIGQGKSLEQIHENPPFPAVKRRAGPPVAPP
jgi:hypothetical protein